MKYNNNLLNQISSLKLKDENTGLLNLGPALIEYMKKGSKIHIKKSQVGSFTKYCNGKVTNECIARGKRSPDPKIRKKAIFAQNSRSWNKK